MKIGFVGGLEVFAESGQILQYIYVPGTFWYNFTPTPLLVS